MTGFWICIGIQLWKRLNTPGFRVCQVCKSFTRFWIYLNMVLNMPGHKKKKPRRETLWNFSSQVLSKLHFEWKKINLKMDKLKNLSKIKRLFLIFKKDRRGRLSPLVVRLWVWLNKHQYLWICLNFVWINSSDYARNQTLNDHVTWSTDFWRCLGL